MDNVAIIEALTRHGWIGGDTSILDTTVGTGEIRKLIDQFRASFTDLSLIDFGPIFASQDGQYVACHGTAHVRQIADFLHIKTAGHSADIGFTTIYRLDRGQVAQLWSEMDFAQLYATNTPPAS
jgi:hypothetical protein